MKSQVEIEMEKLQKLAQRLEKNAYKKAVRAGAKLIKEDLKAHVPTRSGALKQSISTKVDSAKGTTVAYGVVGPRSRFVKAYKGKNVMPSRYAAPLETGPHKKPFLQPSWDANQGKYLAKLQEVLAQELIKEING